MVVKILSIEPKQSPSFMIVNKNADSLAIWLPTTFTTSVPHQVQVWVGEALVLVLVEGLV